MKPAEHRLPIDERWSVWRDVALRGAGFAIGELERLAAPALADVARDGDAESFAAEHERARLAAREQLVALAAEPRLREAIAWQNPAALASGLDTLRRATRANSQSRQHERLLARYLQRYAAKNDTIGFFGPVGWATIDHAADVLVLSSAPNSGSDPVALAPQLAVEPWALYALAAALAADGGLRGSLIPRRHPSWRTGPTIDGTPTRSVLEHVLRLPPLELALFDACDGQATASEVVERLVAAPGAPCESLLWSAMDRLRRGRVLNLAPALNPLAENIDELLRLTETWPDAAPRARWRARFTAIDQGFAELQAAAGDAEAVVAAQQRLAEHFTAATGAAPAKQPGATYAGRTLVYIDARRRGTLHIGEATVRRLGQSLRPVLDAAHWFACQAYAQLDEYAHGLFTRHARDARLPFDTLWRVMQADRGTVEAIVDDVAQQLAERWAAVLAPGQWLEPGVAAARAAEAFGDVAPGWPGAKFQAPDVMLAATDIDAVARGDYRYVLGELHVGDRSLLRQLFLRQHDDAARLMAAHDADLGEPEVRPLFRSDSLLLRTRTLAASPFDFDIECDEVTSPLPRARALRSGELWLVDGPAGLRIRSSERSLDMPWHAFFGAQAVRLAGRGFVLQPALPHTARSGIGELVVSRETWRWPAEALEHLLRPASEGARHFALLRWADAAGLPRRLFYRLPQEPKPLYLDLASPVYAEVFLRLARAACLQGGKVSLAEMLPTPEQCWLADAAGRRYCNEWRMLFVRH